ncbi:MAG: bifunctional GTP diphosphokinase/guanosine-3',5'-bis pyrophosphate 3'-pyrophosphohydrolase [Gammaproteobacteria bacterium]|nr:bifunctional GTP diphosphokinase/guanosine-3',5'-bis pyrophosphate 3'-pyrophosphohydrolase [Gammaproteobacteria bacterium]
MEASPENRTIEDSAANTQLIDQLCNELRDYLDEKQVNEVYRAYLFGARAHEGQRRKSGEPYITHPLSVARILAEMRMDHQSIIAAILHDVIEDTPTAKEQLATEFAPEIADLVDGVSKLTQIRFESKAEAQAENFRKLLLAMAADIRVILIKLADRIHNMRTIGSLAPAKRRRIAKETLDIYVPIGNRLGMNSIRVELQDLGFAALYPMRYEVIKNAMMKARGNRKEIIHKIENDIRDRLQQEGIVAQVEGREKHLHSIYQKMKQKRLSFNEVFDVYAFRLIVDNVDSCYRALGAVHNLYKPLPGRFKDYIAIPKNNGYQSLHTVLFGPYGVPIEIQIRTEEMHRLAEAGIASHWLYKSGDPSSGSNQSRANEWLRGLLDMQKSSGTSMEFLENVKIDLFPDVVYVFTPKGEIMELPRGATPVDFAYAVHTDIGNSCVAAKVSRQLTPLRTPLTTGQTVEIITAPGARPNPSWLNFVVTGKARSHIRHYLKNLKQDEAKALGRRLLERSLNGLAYTLEKVSKSQVKSTLKMYKLDSLDQLLEEIGLGNRMALLVARQLTNDAPKTSNKTTKEQPSGTNSGSTLKNMLNRYAPSWLVGGKNSPTPLAIQGTEGIIVTYARCCRPIPGDPIIGLFSPGRGMVIHVENCKNARDYKKHPERWIDLQWEEQIDKEFPVEVRVEVANQRGVLATVASAIAEMEANIENVHVDDRDSKFTDLVFVINVYNRGHLANIMRRIRLLDEVNKITRSKG